MCLVDFQALVHELSLHAFDIAAHVGEVGFGPHDGDAIGLIIDAQQQVPLLHAITIARQYFHHHAGNVTADG